jgi:NADH-quinone oxidoreductase subunit E
MSGNSEKKLIELMSAERIKDIDHWIKKYPKDEKQSAVMSALRIVQDEHGYLTPELMDAVADYLDMPHIAVYEVASFYTMYEHEPVGRNIISVCTNISCKLRDCDAIVAQLENKLGIQLGQTTDDGRFTLRSVECLGACVNAPMMQINKEYHENLSPESLDAVLEHYQ